MRTAVWLNLGNCDFGKKYRYYLKGNGENEYGQIVSI